VLDGAELMRQIKTDRDVPHSTAEVCLNLWYFVDDTGIVLRTAGKAYALAGSDEEKLAALHLMAGTDHLTATLGRVPAACVLNTEDGKLRGAIPVSAIHDHDISVFGLLIDQIEQELPKGIRSMDGTHEHFAVKIPRNPLIVTTAVYERNDGELVARVGKPD
jgi:hypothetical protein